MGYEVALTFTGLMITLLFTGITGFFPGGIIVPGYLALYINQPLRLAGTLIVALLTVGCYRFVSRYVILFGRRRFIFMILIGGLWTFGWVLVLPSLFPLSLDFRVIGWVIPGLIANHFERQGILVTSAGLITVTTVTFFTVQLFFIIFF